MQEMLLNPYKIFENINLKQPMKAKNYEYKTWTTYIYM